MAKLLTQAMDPRHDAQQPWRAAPRLLRAAAVGAAAVVYLGLGYIAGAWPHPPRLAVVVGLVPLFGWLLAAAWQLRWRVPALGLWALTAVLLWRHLGTLRDHAALVYCIQHVGAMATLALSFGATLWAGHDRALCSRIARACIAGDIDDDYYRYTWQVTLAWTVLFLALGTASVVLFSLGALTWWSLLANVATPLLVGAMFVVEYAVRVRVLPGRPHMSIAATVRGWQRYRAGAR